MKTLADKELVNVSEDTVALTANGVTLVEAIINTQFATSEA